MSGGGSQQTTTSASEPWAAAQPALTQGLNDAQNLYNRGVGARVYTGSTVTPWSSETKTAMGNITDAAKANLGGQGLSGQYQSVINNGGFTGAQLDALNNTRQIANSSFDINSDPGFQQVVDQAQNSVNASASGAGRYGSGVHQQTLTNTIGDLGARQYQSFLARKDAANANLFGMGQQGFGNLGTAYTGMQAPNTDLLNVGAMNEDLSNRQLNDQLRIFNEEQNNDWNNLARLNGIATGAGQIGGTRLQSQPGQNPFLTALGYGSSGLGLLGSLF